jgi:hypothetical protein
MFRITKPKKLAAQKVKSYCIIDNSYHLHNKEANMSRTINVAISEAKLAELMLAGHLCAAELQCLDRQSKQALWQLCLWSCGKRSQCAQCHKICGMAAKLPDFANELATAIVAPIANKGK